MIKPTHLLTIPFVSRLNVRPELQGVYFHANANPSVAVATDSYSLLEISHENTDMSDLTPLILPTHVLKSISAPVDIRKANDHNDVELFNENTTTKTTPINGKYPPYESLFPDDEPLAYATVNASYLKRMAEAIIKLEKLHPNGVGDVTIEIRDPNQPVVFKATRHDEDKNPVTLRGLLMPIRKP